MSEWVQFTCIKASKWTHAHFHFQSRLNFCHSFAIVVRTRRVTVKEMAVLFSPLPAMSKGTFYKLLSQITVLRLHLDYLEKWERTKMLQFLLDESYLLTWASELFVHAFVLSWCWLLFHSCCCWMIEQEGKRLSLEAKKKKGKRHTYCYWLEMKCDYSGKRGLVCSSGLLCLLPMNHRRQGNRYLTQEETWYYPPILI